MTPPSGNGIEDRIAALTQCIRASRESIGDTTRLGALKAARGLIDALGSPLEIVIHDVVFVCIDL